MGLFGRNKQDKENLAGALDEFRRTEDLARASTAKVEQEAGMDVGSIFANANAAMAGGGMERLMAYRDRAMRVNQRGIEMPATLRSVALGEPNPMLGGIPADLQLTVEPPGAAPYEVRTDQALHESMANGLAAGQRVTVKVDPEDPQCLLLWGTGDAPAPAPAPAAAAAPAPADDRIERIAKLHDLRTRGILTEEEFQAQKAKLLAQ
jgi:hypothetical protein